VFFEEQCWSSPFFKLKRGVRSHPSHTHAHTHTLFLPKPPLPKYKTVWSHLDEESRKPVDPVHTQQTPLCVCVCACVCVCGDGIQAKLPCNRVNQQEIQWWWWYIYVCVYVCVCVCVWDEADKTERCDSSSGCVPETLHRFKERSEAREGCCECVCVCVCVILYYSDAASASSFSLLTTRGRLLLTYSLSKHCKQFIVSFSSFKSSSIQRDVHLVTCCPLRTP